MTSTLKNLSKGLACGALLLSTVLASSIAASDQQRPLQSDCYYDDSKLSEIISSSPLLSFHRSLVEVESVIPNEHDIGKFLAHWLQAHNFSVLEQKVPTPDEDKPSRFNILALPPGADPATANVQTIVTSHMDTVPPFIAYNVSAPSTSEIKREHIWISGRGTVDAKACVATQVYAVLGLLEDELIDPSKVGLLFVVGEEGRGDGMKTFSKSLMNVKAEYKTVIFGEPTELKLASGHKGITLATIKAKGKAAHSGYPWLGKSANSMIIPALTIMDRLGEIPEEDGGLPSSEKFGNTTVNLGLLQGGVAANVVPEEATLQVACRLAAGSPEKARDIINDALKPLGDGFEITFTQGYGPVNIDADVDGFDTVTVNYGTDIPNLAMKEGVKKYLYGPGTITVAHSDHEGLTVGDLEDAVEGYRKLILHSLK